LASLVNANWFISRKQIHPMLTHLIHGSLDPRESAPKWHLNQFSRFWGGLKFNALKWFSMGWTIPKIASSHKQISLNQIPIKYVVPWAQLRHLAKRHLDRFSSLWRLTNVTTRQTDIPRYSVCSNRPHLPHWVYKTQPKNNNSDDRRMTSNILLYRVSQKTGHDWQSKTVQRDHLPNADWFAIFFHCKTLRSICNKTIIIIKEPSTPKMCCYTTMCNIWHLFHNGSVFAPPYIHRGP